MVNMPAKKKINAGVSKLNKKNSPSIHVPLAAIQRHTATLGKKSRLLWRVFQAKCKATITVGATINTAPALNLMSQHASLSSHKIMWRFSYCRRFFITACNMQYSFVL